MRFRSLVCSAVALVGIVALATVLMADPPRLTRIDIDALDCPSCAKKVVKTVSAVAGVAAVTTDVKTSSASVTPKANQAPSPRALWEAVEKAGFTPTRIEGPSGTYSSKPQS